MAAGGGKKTTTTKKIINKPDNKKPCECSLSGCDMTFYFPRQNKGSVPITSCLWSFASAETTRQGHRAKSPRAATSRKLGVRAEGMRDEAELPSQMAIKILGGALIQRRESGWVSLPYRNNQAGHVAAARVHASDLTDGGQGFLNTCWRDVRFGTQTCRINAHQGGGIIGILTPHRALG